MMIVNFFRKSVYVFRRSHTFDFLPFSWTCGIGIIWARTGCERNVNVVRTGMKGKWKVVERNMIVKNKVLSTFQNIGGQSASLTPLLSLLREHPIIMCAA